MAAGELWVEVKSNGLMFNPMGQKPNGHVIFTPEGRVSFTLTAENRQAPESVQDRADLFNSMIAYTGTYQLNGNQWVTRVDAAWNPQWVGTEQTRYFLIEGDKLVVRRLGGDAELARKRVNAQHRLLPTLSGWLQELTDESVLPPQA